ncbi:unnamed protein product [Rotaria magnacalcarata]|uniref:Uncharacterized protein n=1 Tax=Rotaria magnacalcarata TaxID=392030 RepID=A0A819VCA8_9BILA|nr:unnamed protein product [Rotaria magnacalcarata]CAF4106744.1 unnamed protein product [Rotaria magnacalcarata]
MALQSSINSQNVDDFDYIHNDDENQQHHHHQESDEEIGEAANDLIENYRFLTQHCGALRKSPTANLSNSIQQKQSNQASILRFNSFQHENTIHNNDDEHEYLFPSAKQQHSSINDLNNNNHDYTTTATTTTATSRIPPTIYYDDTDDNELEAHSFSLIKLFARMKTRLKHDKRYHPKPSHELLPEEEPLAWYELTKNVRNVLTKVLVPETHDETTTNRTKKIHNRKVSYRKSCESYPVLSKDNDDDDKIHIEIIDPLNTDGDEEYDEIIWNDFLTCTRGPNYRRCGVCKAVDRQKYHGQLVYFYGVANNILFDENLKASGLG